MAHLGIRFINGSDLIGKGIDWVTNSLWDHVELITPEGTYIGAHAGSGIQERPADYCKSTRERRYAIPCTDEQLEKILASARKDIGIPYDYLDILGLLFHDRKLHADSREICSEFVCQKAMDGGIPMLNVQREFTYLVTPELLHTSTLLTAFGGHCTYSFPVTQ